VPMYAAIIRFLCYNPLPEAKGWGARLVRQRTTLGLSQKEAAKGLGVDQGILARWERGEREPAGGFLERVKRFLKDTAVSGARRAGSQRCLASGAMLPIGQRAATAFTSLSAQLQ
jgi:transcriptional regulator with XRE-family HTH domain